MVIQQDAKQQSGVAVTASSNLSREISDQIRYTVGVEIGDARPADFLQALSLALRRKLTRVMLETERRRQITRPKRIYYLSMEFLIGRSLQNNLLNLRLQGDATAALDELESNLDGVAALEHDAALGNGGLGRLAACFIDSMATLDLAGFGCGIRYDLGLFKQEILDGRQREKPDCWNADASPWLIERAGEAHQIPLYGRIEQGRDAQGRYNPMWLDWQSVTSMPYDMPIAGSGGRTVNHLRLYAARASDSFDMDIFNSGDYVRAVQQKIASENISKVLYPSDAFYAGKELRLVQEYFLVASSLRDIVRQFLKEGLSFADLPDRVAIQMNDTHPALAVAELMRILVDERDLTWEEAWDLTCRTMAYTNHTLLPEALEKWPIELLERVLPRHLQLIYEINRRFLDRVRDRWPDDPSRAERMSVIEEGSVKQVRMAHLAVIGSHSVNGVAALHSELLRSRLMPDFHEFFPGKFTNKTNGVTPRRWIQQANPELADLLNETLGSGWVVDLEKLRGLEAHASDQAVLARLAAIKRANKVRFAERIFAEQRLKLDPASLFDIQSKRMHEYKRQLLNLLHVVHLYLRIVDDGAVIQPRTHIFSGKAAPGYYTAKLIIHAINAVATTVNHDSRCRDQLNVVFVPDYKVSVAEWIIPAADLSEQISTAGLEASGTGNMKFAMNGALTVGTHDGANIEMAAEIGAENFYLFGLKADEIEILNRSRSYAPRSLYEADGGVRRVLNALKDRFSSDAGVFQPLFDLLLWNDTYFLLADFNQYVAVHERASLDFADARAWSRRALYNIARSGRFSSDRTIQEYSREIWHA
jgi:starch phosphorylase